MTRTDSAQPGSSVQCARVAEEERRTSREGIISPTSDRWRSPLNNCFQRVADCFDRRSMINQLATSQECRQACKKKKKKKKIMKKKKTD